MQQPIPTGASRPFAPSFCLTERHLLGPGAILLAITAAVALLSWLAIPWITQNTYISPLGAPAWVVPRSLQPDPPKRLTTFPLAPPLRSTVYAASFADPVYERKDRNILAGSGEKGWFTVHTLAGESFKR